MRTTLNFDDNLIREAKKLALEEGETLTRIIERALRNYLHPPVETTSFKLTLLTKEGRVVPGIDWDDRDSIYERMEGRS